MATQPVEFTDDLQADASDEGTFAGLRMTADEFLELPDDGHKYELIDGVVMMSPRATPPHYRTTRSILRQLDSFCIANPIGEVFSEIDVRLGQDGSGRDLVYAPDIVFVRHDRQIDLTRLIDGVPDLAVEVISRGSRRIDTITMRNDCEKFGVREYWLIDPARKSMTFLRLKDGKYAEVAPDGNKYASEAVPGFVLDVAAVRETFKPW